MLSKYDLIHWLNSRNWNLGASNHSDFYHETTMESSISSITPRGSSGLIRRGVDGHDDDHFLRDELPGFSLPP